MTQKLVVRLLLLAILLPIAMSVVLATGHLLRSMDDILWGNILLRVALAGGIVWLIVLILLLLALTVRVISQPNLREDNQPIRPNKKEDE